MKKLSFFLMAMLFSVMSFAAEATFDFSAQSYANQTAVNTVTVNEDVTITFAGGGNNNTPKYYTSGTAVRMYPKNNFTVTTTTGKLTKIVITFGSSDGTLSIASNVGSYASGTWTGEDASVILTVDPSATSGNRRIKAITVTYGEVADNYVAAPSISGDVNFIESTEVAIAAGEGLKVYYTLDGTDPTNASTEYTAAFEVTETTTVKAIAYNGENASEVATQTFSKAIQVTCAEAKEIALALNDKATTELFYVVKGYVTSTVSDWKSGKQSFWIADTKDGGNVFEAYYCFISEAAVVGNYVQLFGQLKRFGSTAEMSDGQATIIPEPAPEPEHTYTVAGSSEAAFGTAWDPANANNDMKKQEDGTYKWEKEGLELLAGEVAFKVTEDHAWTVAYPAQDYKLAIAETGIYTLTITFNPADKAVAATATKTGDVVIIPTIAMHGNFLGSWKDTENFTLAADEATATLTLTIAEGNYEFGMRIGGSGNWTSNGVAFTRENASAEIVAGAGNLTLAADVAGEYTFTWTFETNTLTVTYPALVTAIEVNVTDATATSGEWSIDLAGSWNDQALTIKLWQDNTQGFGSYAPNTETGYYILLGAKELTPTTEGVYADNGDGTFTFTCSATEGTNQYNITVTGTSGTQEVYYEPFELTNLEVTDNETFLVLSASNMNMGLEVMLGVNMDGTLMDASQILFGEEVLPILSSEPVTVTFNEELQTEVYTARVVVEHMGGPLGLELIMYAGGATSEPIAVNVIGATAAVDEATDVLKITGDWDGIAFELRINAYDPAQTLYDAPQIAEFETEEVYATSSLVTVIKTGENIDVIGEFMSPMGDIYNVYVNAIFAAGPETGVDNINTTVAPVKVIENGQIFIISNGVKYNAQGAKL